MGIQNKKCQSVETIDNMRCQKFLFFAAFFQYFTTLRLDDRRIFSLGFILSSIYRIRLLFYGPRLDHRGPFNDIDARFITDEYAKRCARLMKCIDYTFESANVDYRPIDRLLYRAPPIKWNSADRENSLKTHVARLDVPRSTSSPKTSSQCLPAVF